MPESEFTTLTLKRNGPIARLTFNRPEAANALSHTVLAELESAALSLRDDIDTRVVIVTGQGKHFSSGADLRAQEPKPRNLLERQRRTRIGERAINALYGVDQITIAAWNGAAMGGGACVATACDLRIGAEDCFMQYPEIDIGLNLMWQSLPLLVHLVGPARAKRLVVGGERVQAKQLEQWGLLDDLVPNAELLKTAETLAAHYAAKPPIAAQMIKRSVNRIVSALDSSIMHMDADQNLFTQHTKDRDRAIEAYLNKTEAEFTGD